MIKAFLDGFRIGLHRGIVNLVGILAIIWIVIPIGIMLQGGFESLIDGRIIRSIILFVTAGTFVYGVNHWLDRLTDRWF